MFTDEKIFTKNGYFNRKNDVVWTDDRSDATERGGLYSKEKYPVSITYTMYVLTSVLCNRASTLSSDTFSFLQFEIRTFLSRTGECLAMLMHIMRVAPRIYY